MQQKTEPSASVDGVELSAKVSRVWHGFNLFSYDISVNNVSSVSSIIIENPIQENNDRFANVSLGNI